MKLWILLSPFLKITCFVSSYLIETKIFWVISFKFFFFARISSSYHNALNNVNYIMLTFLMPHICYAPNLCNKGFVIQNFHRSCKNHKYYRLHQGKLIIRWFLSHARIGNKNGELLFLTLLINGREDLDFIKMHCSDFHALHVH